METLKSLKSPTFLTEESDLEGGREKVYFINNSLEIILKLIESIDKNEHMGYSDTEYI